MPTFLHTADWQIGRQFGRFSEEDAALLAEERFQVIERIAHLATDRQVDAVLVAGDIFDAQTVSSRTLHRVFQTMSKFSGLWILLPGNHDAALAESVWTHAQRLNAIPDNVHLLSQPEVKLFPELGFAVLPAPLFQRQIFDDVTSWFDQAETPSELVRIGLAHGSVTGFLPESVDSPNPIEPTRADSARLDYLALGDWHGTKSIDERTWYSGTPEQERFKNNGAGNVLWVKIERPGAVPVVESIPVGRYQWIQQQWHFSVEADVEHFLKELNTFPEMSVLDFSFEGQITLTLHQHFLDALKSAEAKHRSLQYDITQLHVEPTEEDIVRLQADGYVEETIATLRQWQTSGHPQADTARDALILLADFLRR